jgi:hypothetical protein
LDFGGEYSVYGSALKKRGDICSSRCAAGFQMPAIDCAETVSGADYARIDAVEILMWDTNATVDHRATEQIAPASRCGTNDKPGFHRAGRLIEVSAINMFFSQRLDHDVPQYARPA